jgi:hypothetical protein
MKCLPNQKPEISNTYIVVYETTFANHQRTVNETNVYFIKLASDNSAEDSQTPRSVPSFLVRLRNLGSESTLLLIESNRSPFQFLSDVLLFLTRQMKCPTRFTLRSFLNNWIIEHFPHKQLIELNEALFCFHCVVDRIFEGQEMTMRPRQSVLDTNCLQHQHITLIKLINWARGDHSLPRGCLPLLTPHVPHRDWAEPHWWYDPGNDINGLWTLVWFIASNETIMSIGHSLSLPQSAIVFDINRTFGYIME